MDQLVRLGWLLVAAIALYTGSIVAHRYLGQRAQRYVEPDPLAAYGTGVRILQFYTTAREIAPGGKSLICMGVLNARSVKLEPPVESVWPTISRCFEVRPAATTTYKLTAEGDGHTTVSTSFEITVKPQ